MANTPDFEPLFAYSATAKMKCWRITVDKRRNGVAIVTEHGYVDGKQVKSERIVTEGKNRGRSNETTVLQQAVLEATSKWNQKKDSGYDVHASSSPKPILDDQNQKPILPMLALDFHKRGAKDIVYPCYVQSKLDGVRAVYQSGRITSRKGKPFAMQHIIDELDACPGSDGLILDGELYSDAMTFQDIVSVVKTQQYRPDDSRTKKIYFWVYDMIAENVPYEERYERLKRFFDSKAGKQLKHVKMLDTKVCKSLRDVKSFHDAYVSEGYEGLILRNAKGLYRVNVRSKDIQKYKEFKDDEYEVVDFTQGDGIELGLVLWICITPKTPQKRFTVRPRGTHEERAKLFVKAKSYVGKMLTVRYQELTDDGVPRFPVGIAFRDYEN